MLTKRTQLFIDFLILVSLYFVMLYSGFNATVSSLGFMISYIFLLFYFLRY
ncbi:hypothetical protein [Sharpea azabuensis]|uniref:hypothetical protein n=1 Tax=Sharpea azabuensis TaxID=322505 RepID=UPI0012DF8862|nr:hypothetical protein [Sharpea azabuensis]MDD6512567.1 hypothetical protein [Sharpea azabuensis]